MAMRKTAVVGVVAALMAVASPARADLVVGGQSAKAGGCDVVLAQVVFDTRTGRIKSITGVQVDC